MSATPAPGQPAATGNTPPLLSIQDLDFSYSGRSATLQALTLTLRHGEAHGLVGLNGAGKSTLIALITGLLKPQRGTVLLEGKPSHPGNAHVSLVPQEYAFYNRLSVLENLRYFAALSVATLTEPQAAAIARVIQLCQLGALLQQRAGRLSGGEKRRLNLAIGLLPRVSLLILDEPTANVDPHSRAVILQLLRTLNTAGCGILYTSHLLSEIETICSHVSILDRGRLRISGSLEELDNQGAETLDLLLPGDAPARLAPLPGHWQRVDGRVTVDMRHDTLPDVLARLQQHGIRPLALQYSRTSLRTLLQRVCTTGEAE